MTPIEIKRILCSIWTKPKQRSSLLNGHSLQVSHAAFISDPLGNAHTPTDKASPHSSPLPLPLHSLDLKLWTMRALAATDIPLFYIYKFFFAFVVGRVFIVVGWLSFWLCCFHSPLLLLLLLLPRSAPLMSLLDIVSAFTWTIDCAVAFLAFGCQLSASNSPNANAFCLWF